MAERLFDGFDQLHGWQVRTSFPDSELLHNPGVLLVRLDPHQISNLGRFCLPMLQSGFTKQGSAVIFLLSYNLHFRTPENTFEPVFYDQSVENLPSDTPYQLLPTDIVGGFSGNRREIAPTANERSEALFFSYIATSLFRIFTKPHQSYIRGWNQIVSGFSRFYNLNPPVSLPAPSLKAMESLEWFWRGNPVNKTNLFKLLYAGGGDHNKAPTFKMFLYDSYLTNTGLHVVDIFVKLTRALNCSNDELLGVIDGVLFKWAKEGLGVMMRLMESEEEENKRRMWKYGRIFDESFMAILQTKSCVKLVYALAVALKEVAPSENDGILNIAQLQSVTPEWKIKCDKYGKWIVENLRKGV